MIESNIYTLFCFFIDKIKVKYLIQPSLVIQAYAYAMVYMQCGITYVNLYNMLIDINM